MPCNLPSYSGTAYQGSFSVQRGIWSRSILASSNCELARPINQGWHHLRISPKDICEFGRSCRPISPAFLSPSPDRPAGAVPPPAHKRVDREQHEDARVQSTKESRLVPAGNSGTSRTRPASSPLLSSEMLVFIKYSLIRCFRGLQSRIRRNSFYSKHLYDVAE